MWGTSPYPPIAPEIRIKIKGRNMNLGITQATKDKVLSEDVGGGEAVVLKSNDSYVQTNIRDIWVLEVYIFILTERVKTAPDEIFYLCIRLWKRKLIKGVLYYL